MMIGNLRYIFKLIPLICILIFVCCNSNNNEKSISDLKSNDLRWGVNITELHWDHNCNYCSLTYDFKTYFCGRMTGRVSNCEAAMQKMFDESYLLKGVRFDGLFASTGKPHISLDSMLIKAEYKFESIPGFALYRFSVLSNVSWPREIFIGYADSKNKGYLLSASSNETLIQQFNKMIAQNKGMENIDRICLSKILLAVKYRSPCVVFIDSSSELEMAAYLCANEAALLRERDFETESYLYLENLSSIDSISTRLRSQISEYKAINSQLPDSISGTDFLALRDEERAAIIYSKMSEQVEDILRDLRSNNIEIKKPSIISDPEHDVVSITVLNMYNEFAFWNISFSKEGQILDMSIEREYDISMWLPL